MIVRYKLKLKRFKTTAMAVAMVFLMTWCACACGPFFPNNLLDAGDHGVLQAPIADFQRELTRMRLVPATARAVPLNEGQTYYDQTTSAEMFDLTAALKRQGTPPDLATVILRSHLAERMKLNAFLAGQVDFSQAGSGTTDSNGESEYINTNTPPPFPAVAVTPGLPTEFADYFAGAIASQNGEDWLAKRSWQQVLNLPPSERRFKSTWAAFMLGKNAARNTNEFSENEGLDYFEQVRGLARSGFADSLGLATASIGAEARIYLRRENYERAIALYLDQFTAGDNSAINSLRFTAQQIFAQTNLVPASLTNLALNPQTRQLITAYLISRHPYSDAGGNESNPSAFDPATMWLNAVESANVADAESAGQFALAAYQAGHTEIAQRWINRAPREAVARWIQAKLDLRAGKIDDAAKLLAGLCRQFPVFGSGTNGTTRFADCLYVNINENDPDLISVGRQALGELGVLHLARREYAESLDALLRSGYWMDAVYVAECVLTLDELKIYVDRTWPEVSRPQIAKENIERSDADTQPNNCRQQIRWLLARRLARDARYAEARAYIPDFLKPNFDLLMTDLHSGRDESLSKTQRASALYAASWITRTNGLDIYGTEAAPDWAANGGVFDWGGVTPDSRMNDNFRILPPTQDELVRARQHVPFPNTRFHYRFLAADLACQAGDLMPDNSDDTARVLCTGGSWIKYLNPMKADPIYKTLVRRCRQTAIGRQADRMRWFPVLDSSGNPIPYTPPVKVPST